MHGTDIGSFQVRRNDLAEWRWRTGAVTLDDGAILVAPTRFALTANTITYGRTGDRFGYWRFFPAEPPWGHIPVWATATVLASRCAGLAEGQSVYGFLPMASAQQIRPGAISATRFIDTSAHRAALPATYNEYALNQAAGNDLHLVLRPLFSLSYFLSRHLIASGFFGAGSVVISSASSKAAIGLAFLLRQSGVDVIALSSEDKAPFLRSLGHYSEVLSYAAIGALPRARTVYVDIAGDAAIRGAVHDHFRDALTASIGVGATRGAALVDADLPGPAPVFFFTPEHILACRERMGAARLRDDVAGAWQAFEADAARWLVIDERAHWAALGDAYDDVLRGRIGPDRAVVLGVNEAEKSWGDRAGPPKPPVEI